MKQAFLSAALPLLLLGACGKSKPASDEPIVPNTQIDAAAAAKMGSKDVAYECDPAMNIAIRYDNSDPNKMKAIVTLDGKKYLMTSVVSGSGARYFTENGRAAGMTLTWWGRDDKGGLYEGKADDPTETTLAMCKAKM